MITCPRCGYQAPDGTPYCPRCGYGKPQPYIMPPEQNPQQIPVITLATQYQMQQDQPQYVGNELSPQTPNKSRKKRHKKKSLLKKILIGIGVFLVVLFIAFIALFISVWNDDPDKDLAPTPNMETLVAEINDKNATSTMIVILSATPTFTPTTIPTNTPEPTYTPLLTDTPVLTDTPIPVVAWSSDQTYSGNSYTQTGNGIRGSIVQDTSSDSCRIKGNINSKGERIYHCPGWRDYNKTEIDTGKGERWFCSAAEAEASGWRAAAYKHGACGN